MNNIAYEELLKDLTPFQQATILYNDEHISEEDKRCMLHQLQREADESLKKQIEEFQDLMLLQVADAKAHIILPIIQERIDICSDLAGVKGLELYQMYLKQNTRRKNN